jgi:hypothetical protein
LWSYSKVVILLGSSDMSPDLCCLWLISRKHKWHLIRVLFPLSDIPLPTPRVIVAAFSVLKVNYQRALRRVGVSWLKDKLSILVLIQAPKADITVRFVLGPIIALCRVDLSIVAITIVLVLSAIHKVNLASWLLLL